MGDALTVIDRFLEAFWRLLLDGGAFLIIGLVAAGLVKAFFSPRLMGRWLGANSPAAALKAALLGAPLPICSCGVVPTALALRRQGASRAATQSFLISTPETGVDSIAISYAYLGPALTVLRPLAAVVSGVVAGALEWLTGRHGADADPAPADAPPDPAAPDADATAPAPARSAWARFVDGQRYAFAVMLPELAGWMLLGLAIAAALQVAVPNDWLGQLQQAGLPAWVWYVVMVALGLPMYVCASLATPVVAVLIAKGLPVGAGLVFLLAGPATNVATMGLIHRYLGRRSLIIYLVAITACAVGFGIAADALRPVWPAGFATDLTASASGLLPAPVAAPLAALSIILLVRGFLLERLARVGHLPDGQRPIPRRLRRPLVLSVWLLAAMVFVTALTSGLLGSGSALRDLPAALARYNATRRPLAAPPALSAGQDLRQAPPVPMTLADLDALMTTLDPATGLPLATRYNGRLLDLVGVFRTPATPGPVRLPDGKSVPSWTATLSADGSAKSGPTIDFLPERWPGGAGPTGPVRVQARLWLETPRGQPPRRTLYGNEVRPLALSDAVELGLVDGRQFVRGAAFEAPRLPLDQLEQAAAANPAKAVAWPAGLAALDGRPVSLDGYYVFTFPAAEAGAPPRPVVGLHFFDGQCCGVFPGVHNSVLVEVAAPGSAPAGVADPFAGLRFGQRVTVAGTLRLPAVTAGGPAQPIVLANAQVAQLHTASVGDVRTVVLVGLAVLLLIGRATGQAWARQLKAGELAGGWSAAAAGRGVRLNREA